MRWLPLVHGQGPLTAANGFASQADVVIEARRAGDLLEATPMDRPEDVEAQSGHRARLRRADLQRAAQARAGRRGQSARRQPLRPHRRDRAAARDGKPDHAATECDWGFFLLGGDPGDPTHGARYRRAVSANGWLAAPDNVAFDPKGRIWISTDGQDDSGRLQRQPLRAPTVSGPGRGADALLLPGAAGAEICGPTFTPDGRTLFLAVQHPGDERLDLREALDALAGLPGRHAAALVGGGDHARTTAARSGPDRQTARAAEVEFDHRHRVHLEQPARLHEAADIDERADRGRGRVDITVAHVAEGRASARA